MLVNLLIRCKNDILHWIQHQVGFRGIWLISSFAVETCQIWRQTTHKSLCFLDFTERWLYIVSGFQLVCKRGDEASRCYWELWIRELVNFSHSLLTGFLQYQSLYTDVSKFRDFNIICLGNWADGNSISRMHLMVWVCIHWFTDLTHSYRGVVQVQLIDLFAHN